MKLMTKMNVHVNTMINTRGPYDDPLVTWARLCKRTLLCASLGTHSERHLMNILPRMEYKVSALTHNAKPTQFQDRRTMEGSVEAYLLLGHDVSPKYIPGSDACT